MALRTIQAAAAERAIERLAATHPEFDDLIRSLAVWLLERAHHGLRDGIDDSRTYDLSFVGARGSFACITAQPGKWNRVEPGRLRIEARFEGMPDDLHAFQPKTRREAEAGWHFTHLEPGAGLAAVLRDLRRTRR